MIFFIGFILFAGGFALGYITAALFTVDAYHYAEKEQECTPGIIPRADCMPPGCNDYPECNHRY